MAAIVCHDIENTSLHHHDILKYTVHERILLANSLTISQHTSSTFARDCQDASSPHPPPGQIGI